MPKSENGITQCRERFIFFRLFSYDLNCLPKSERIRSQLPRLCKLDSPLNRFTFLLMLTIIFQHSDAMKLREFQPVRLGRIFFSVVVLGYFKVKFEVVDIVSFCLALISLT